MNHNPTKNQNTVAELRARLAVTTDPDEYDQIQAGIKQAEKAAHLHEAGKEVERQKQEAAARAKLEEQHQANVEKAKQLLDGFAQQDKDVEKTLAAAYAAMHVRYLATQEYTQAANDARYTAERLGLPEPKFPDRQDTTTGDLASPQAFAKSLISEFGDQYAAHLRHVERIKTLGKKAPRQGRE